MKEIKEKTIIQNFINKKAYKETFPESVNEYAKVFCYDENEIILSQGSNVKYISLLIDGKCDISWNNLNGEERTLYSLDAPCFIGEVEMLNEKSSLQVKALKDCYLISLPLKECKNILFDDKRFLLSLSKELAGRGRRVSLALINGFAYPLENRLAKYILENSEGKIFKVKKVQIAQVLGVSYRHTELVMKQFVDKNYLTKDKLVYTIVNKKELLKLAQPLIN